MNIDNILDRKCTNSEDMEKQDPKSENQSEEKEMGGKNEIEKKELLYSSSGNPEHKLVDCNELREFQDDKDHRNISECININHEKNIGKCNNVYDLSNIQINDPVVEIDNPTIGSNNSPLRLVSGKNDKHFDPVDLDSNVNYSVNTLNSEEPEPPRNASTIVLNKFNEDSQDLQNTYEKHPDTEVNILEKTEDNKSTCFNSKSNLNIGHLMECSEQRNNESPTSVLVHESINNSKEIYVNDKNPTISNEKKANVNERSKQIIELLDHINRLKNNSAQSNTSTITELLNSKGVYLGMLTELSLYEELLKYLLERRNLCEETFECNGFEDNKLSLDQPDNYAGYFTNLQRGNAEIHNNRRTVLEGIVDFAEKRIYIDLAFTNQLENFGTKSTNRIIKPLNAYYELFSRDCIFFFDNLLTHDEDFKNFLVPIQAFNTPINLTNINLNYRINKIRKEIGMISKYSTYETPKALDKRICKLDSFIKNFERNKFKILENCQPSHFLSANTDEALTRNKLNGSLQALISNNISSIKVNFGDKTRFLKGNLFCNVLRSKFQDIQHRLNNLDKHLLANENNIDEESKIKSIVNKLLTAEDMLRTIIPESYKIKNTSKIKVNMEEILLDGFTIGEARKSDLKKISNLVKSKVSSCTGRRDPKHETEEYDTEVSEVETHRAAENEKIKSLLEDFGKIENKEFIIRFDDFSTISSKLMEKDDIVIYFLSMLESIDMCEKMHKENLINLDKIQGVTNILLEIVEKNLKKVGE